MFRPEYYLMNFRRAETRLGKQMHVLGIVLRILRPKTLTKTAYDFDELFIDYRMLVIRNKIAIRMPSYEALYVCFRSLAALRAKLPQSDTLVLIALL